MQHAPEDAERSVAETEEDGGGPVKSFLEHLEDLRWVLVKSVVAILVGMLVCMVAGNKLVAFLTWPLEHARKATPLTTEVPVMIGSGATAV